MSHLLRELVDLGRPSSDRVAPFDAIAVVEDVARLLRRDPRGEGVEIDVEADASASRPLCSARDRVTQVLVNLGLNALDALQGSGSLRFRAGAAPTGDGLRLVVSDSGPGMPPDIADHAFDPFYTTKPPGQGSGLGLFVSEGIVRGLGGQLELETQTRPSAPDAREPGQPTGSTFVVTLPWCGCGRCARPGGRDG